MAHPPYQNGDGNLGWPHPSDNTNSSNHYSYPPGLRSQPNLFNGSAHSVAQFQKPPDPNYQTFWQAAQTAQPAQGLPIPIPIPQLASAHLVSPRALNAPTNVFHQLGPAIAGAQPPPSMISHPEPPVETARPAQFQPYIPQPSHTESNI